MKRVLCALLLIYGSACYGQSPFKMLTKVTPKIFRNNHLVLTGDSSIGAFRFIANIATYAEPGNILMAGAGYGFQHLKYDFNQMKWIAQWSINAVGFAGGSVAPTTPASIVSIGIMAGVLNNLLMAGPIYNPGTKQFCAAVSIGINLNN